MRMTDDSAKHSGPDDQPGGPSRRTGGFPGRGVEVAAKLFFLVVWLGCLIVCLVRIFRAISFTTPWLITTRGYEEEALFSIWKFTQGLPVFNDPLKIPYSASYFNWAFYFFYGSATKIVLALFHLDAVWLPTICRLLTLSFGLLGGGLFFLALRECGPGWRFWSWPFLLLWCVIPVINPLCGFWLIAARPDIGAFAFEMAGLIFFLRYLRTGRIFLIVAAAAVFYAAWSFKQVNVSALGGISLTLLVLRDWRALAVLLGLWLPPVMLTLVIGGSDYRYCLLMSQLHCSFLPSNVVVYVIEAIKGNPLIPMILAVMAYLALTQRRALVARSAELTLLATSLCALALTLLLLCKTGGAENYFIPLGAWLALWFITWSGRIQPPIFHLALVLSSFLVMLKLGVIVFKRSDDTRWMHEPHLRLAERLAVLPGPVFVTDLYGNLPWIQRQAPHFVIAYSYDLDSRAGVQHERGGWEGLMRDGYFNTVVTQTADDPAMTPYLGHYEFIAEDDGYRFYRRKP